MKLPTLGAVGAVATAALAILLAQPAAAAPVDLEAGAVFPSSGNDAMAVAITDALPFIPVTDAVTQVAAFVPLLDGRYAGTFEIRTRAPRGAYFGVGAGIGRLNVATGPVVDAIGGFPTGMPNVSVALRFYASTSSGVGTAGFAGVRVRL